MDDEVPGFAGREQVFAGNEEDREDGKADPSEQRLHGTNNFLPPRYAAGTKEEKRFRNLFAEQVPALLGRED